MNFIKKIQQKPQSTRVFILWVSVILVMIAIIAIGLFSFSHSIKTKKIGENKDETSLPSLFESLKRDFKSLKVTLEASLENINLEKNEK